MTNTCVSCASELRSDAGVCASCDAVILRSYPWHPVGDAPRAVTPMFRSSIPELRGTWLKVEGAQPSGSFKDRVMETLVGEAKRSGAKGAVVASSGNAAVAAASWSSRAGLPLLILVPERAPENILRLLAHRKQAVLRIGDGPAIVHGLAKRIAHAFGLTNLASTFGASGCEWACRGIGAEIAAQLPGSRVDAVAAAVSVGPVLLGTANGLVESGAPMPRLIAGQAAGCAPIARAFSTGDERVREWTGEVETHATSIADRLSGYAHEGTFLLERVRASSGAVEAVDEAELLRLRSLLAAHDGLDVELSSCAAVGALLQSGDAGPNTVCVLTGSGVRETLSATQQPECSDRVDEFFDAVLGGRERLEEVRSWATA